MKSEMNLCKDVGIEIERGTDMEMTGIGINPMLPSTIFTYKI